MRRAYFLLLIRWRLVRGRRTDYYYQRKYAMVEGTNQ